MDFSRQEQLDQANVELKRHVDLGRSITVAKKTHAAQVSHLEGVYAEVDKLTKGKSLVPTSDLLVEIVNSLISDAKGLIYRDTYLDRLKTFVPAGDNPAYPDVLVALRILQQTLSRFNSMLLSEDANHAEVGEQLRTVLAALQVAEADELKFYNDSPSTEDGEVESDDEEEDDDDAGLDEEEEEEEEDEDDPSDDSEDDGSDAYQEHVWKTEVSARLDRTDVSATWFRRNRDGDYYFNFPRLDVSGIPHYTPPDGGITFLPVSE